MFFFLKIWVYKIYLKPLFKSMEKKSGGPRSQEISVFPTMVPGTSAFPIYCQEKERPHCQAPLEQVVCCRTEGGELMKGDVSWLDNLKISLIMGKLSKRSLWCHCHIDRRDITDVFFWLLCPLDWKLPLTPAWKAINKADTAHYLPKCRAGKSGILQETEGKFRHGALSGKVSGFLLPEEQVWKVTTGVL